MAALVRGVTEITVMTKRILRKREVLERLGIRKTTFHDLFVRTGKLRPLNIGTRAVGYLEDEVDALIEDMRRERDRKPRTVEPRRRHTAEHEATG
jgi:predicted DNA-binding transcriptional regulator AlpA